jgi:hypothetical protein
MRTLQKMQVPWAMLDFDAGVLELQTADGALRERLPEPWRKLGTDIRRVLMDVAGDRMVLTLSCGIEATVELGLKGRDTAEALAGRRVVYLDQNRWSAMAAWRHSHRRISSSEAAAAERLAELATDQQIVLLMSAGHVVETGPLYGDLREALSSTMLLYGRGWQMRNPHDVRKEELITAIDGQQPKPVSLASLGADVLFARRLRRVDGSDLPAPMALALSRIVNVLSICGLLANRDSVGDEGGRAAVERWAQTFAELGARLTQNGASREEVRRAAHKAILRDLYPELLPLASKPALAAWLDGSEADVDAMPYLSRYRAVIFGRLRNANGKWTGNDFTDLNYLCCAAGYADVVVGERRTISDLRAARGVPPGAATATTLAEAVTHLESTN